MIRLHLLGAIDLREEGGREVRPVLAQPKRLALLAYLAAALPRGPHRRDTLLGIFWPELDQDHARNALSKAVHFLRRSLGEAALVSRNVEELGLDGAVVWTDVAAFDAAVHAGRTEEALGLYRGDLLPSFFIPDAPAFEEWLERERTGLRARAAEAARLLAERYEASGEATQAIECARRAVALSNGDERPLRRLVELLDRLGDRSGALHAYDTFARKLAAELEVEPAGETIALIQRIRASGPPRATPTVEPIARQAPQPAVEHAELDMAPRQSPGHRRRLPTIAAAVAGLGILGMLALVRFLRPAPTPGLDADLVAVAPFEVLDPTLALWREGIVDVLSRDLDGAGRLRTVSPAVAIQRWRGRAEAGAARALGRRTGARLVVFGQVMRQRHRLRTAQGHAAGCGRRPDVRGGGTAGCRRPHGRVLESLTLKLLRELGRDRPVGAVRQGAISVRAAAGAQGVPPGRAVLSADAVGFRRCRTTITRLRWIARSLWRTTAWRWRSAGTPSSPNATGRPRSTRARAALLNRGQTTRDSLLLVVGPFAMLLDPADSAYFTRYRQSRAALERASRLYPADPEVWYMLGEVRDHIHFNDVPLTETLDAFDRAIELDSTFGPAYKHTVEFALRLGDTKRARRYVAAYLASTRTGVSIPSLRIDGLLLDPARAGSAETAHLIDTVAGVELWVVVVGSRAMARLGRDLDTAGQGAAATGPQLRRSAAVHRGFDQPAQNSGPNARVSRPLAGGVQDGSALLLPLAPGLAASLSRSGPAGRRPRGLRGRGVRPDAPGRFALGGGRRAARRVAVVERGSRQRVPGPVRPAGRLSRPLPLEPHRPGSSPRACRRGPSLSRPGER